MKIQPGDVVLITGASGGIGVHYLKTLTRLKVKLVLTAFPGNLLEELQADIKQSGCESLSLACDLRDPEDRAKLISAAHDRFGRIDVLINNAGVEYNAYYHKLPESKINDVLNVNLVAPMLLTRQVLPGMLERKRGHIVNLASLAGKSGPAFQEPYAATKAALIAFTSSLRCTYRNTGVGASVIVPGFVEAGIYARLKARTGRPAPWMLGVSQPDSVAKAVVRAIEHNLPEVIINPTPVRPLLAITALFPRLGEWLAAQTGSNEFFRRAVEADEKSGK